MLTALTSQWEVAQLPSLSAYLSFSVLVTAISAGCTDAGLAPSPVSALIALCGHWFGQILVFNLLVGVLLGAIRVLQWMVFGKLRMLELTVTPQRPAHLQLPSPWPKSRAVAAHTKPLSR